MGHSANYAGGKGEKLGKWAKIRGNFDLDYFLGAAARFVISSEAVDSFGSTLGESLGKVLCGLATQDLTIYEINGHPISTYAEFELAQIHGLASQGRSPFKKGWILNF